MTTKLDTYSFSPEPEICFHQVADLAEKPVMDKAGTSKDWMGASSLVITLTGKLVGSNAYSDRDTLMGKLTAGSTVSFYSDTIGFGTEASPKTVWVKDVTFFHPTRKKNYVSYVIVLEIED